MSNDQPGLRIGNRERDEAVRLLQLQADEGRLAPAELTERSAVVQSARTRAELGSAFVDLPVDPPTADLGEFTPYPPASTDPLPAPSAPPETMDRAESGRLPTSPQTKRIGAVVMALMWPAIIAINFIFGWHLWWLFLIAVFGGGWVAWAFGLGNRPGEDD